MASAGLWGEGKCGAGMFDGVLRMRSRERRLGWVGVWGVVGFWVLVAWALPGWGGMGYIVGVGWGW